MEFEAELEIRRDCTTGFIANTRGQKEEISVRASGDSLSGVITLIEEGAKRYGYLSKELLNRTKSLKLRAPDIVTDTLTNKAGARVGLVVSKGHEENGYFEGKGRNPFLGSVVAKEMVVGIEEEINPLGVQVLRPAEEEIKDKSRHLLEFGSGIIVVSLNNAALNPANERVVKEVIENDYPRHYLGAVPVLVSTDFSGQPDNCLRTNVCLLNAYTWFSVDSFLRDLEALLRKRGYNHSLMVEQADGELVNIPRVTPLKLYSSDQTAFVKSMYGG